MRLTGLAHELLLPHLFPGSIVIDGTAGQGHDTLFLARAVGPSGHVVAFDPQPAALTATQDRLNNAGIPSHIIEPCMEYKVRCVMENTNALTSQNQHFASPASSLNSEISNLKSVSPPSPLHLFPFSPFPASSVSPASVKSHITRHTSHVSLVLVGHENAPHLLPNCPPLHAVVLNLGYLPGADHRITTTAVNTLAFLSWAASKLAPDGVLSILAYRAHPGGEEEAQAVAAFVTKLVSENWSHQTHQGPPGRLPSPILHFLTKPSASN